MPFKSEEGIFPGDYESRIFCEDRLTFMKRTPDGLVPPTLIGPPYGIHYSSQFAKSPYTMLPGDDGIDHPTFVRESYHILRTSSYAYFFICSGCYPYHFQCLREADFTIKNCLIIGKGTLRGTGGLKGSYVSNAEWAIFCQKGRRILNSTTLPESRNKEGTMFHKGCQPSKQYKARFSDCWFSSEYPKATCHSIWQRKNGTLHSTIENEVYL